MYSTRKVVIRSGHPLYNYCLSVTQASNNMFNAALYRVRQVLTGVSKEDSALTKNEKDVLDEIRNALPSMGKGYNMPTAGKSFLSYKFLDKLMKTTNNPDYYNKKLPRQSAQHTLKLVVRTMKGFYAGLRAYNADPSKFTGKPQLPHYHKKGGCCTAIITNQDCPIRKGDNGHFFAHLPLTKELCDLGACISGRLKQATITPFHDVFILCFVFEDEKENSPVSCEPKRICAIDFGVDNTAAITNNVGLPSLLFNGGVIKSNNQWYNKRMSEIASTQTKGTTNKFVPTAESMKLCLRRENQISDYMHKLAKRIIQWCVDNKIDTIVMGINKQWRQNSNLGKQNNQKFVQIPFYKLQSYLSYLAEWNGIRIVEQEESYTSKSSFLDNDPIPVYGKTKDKPSFSGKRRPTRYTRCWQENGLWVSKQYYKKDGFRGLYATKDGAVINSDLNGSANIGRKAFPDLFNRDQNVRLDKVEVYYHPDDKYIAKNKQKQKLSA